MPESPGHREKGILGRGTAGARALQQAHAGHVAGREDAGERKQHERAGRQWACDRHTLGVWMAERMQVSGSSVRERGDSGPAAGTH